MRKMSDNFRNYFLMSALLASGLSLSACHPFDATRAGIDPAANVQAPKSVTDSFVVKTPGGDLGVNQNLAQITIKRIALDKEFLFMGSLVQQQPIPSFNGIKSRVVAFHLANNHLFLMDANAGHQITTDLPQNLILAQFPILAQDADSITFDFNAGMANIFMEGDWYSENSDGGTNYNYNLDHAKVLLSFINEAHLSIQSNILVINQVAQVQGQDDSGKVSTSPVAVKYYLSPYQPDPSFVPMPSEGMKTYGFFEVSPQLANDGSTYVRLSKWDVRKPIVYAISANTPAEFRQAITDSVLYWNHIIGQNVMQVIQLTDKAITAPDPDYNIIQWVDNNAAGFAYADAQMDPRSGQILHAQIYLTSVFGNLGKIRAERSLRDNGRPVKIGLNGFSGSAKSDIFCRYENAKALATLEQSLATVGGAQALTAAQALKIAQDYVRETVTHEVGHTLGLRHNFSGSLATNIVTSQRTALYHQYLVSGHAADDTRTTSSIMDYELFEESTLMGDQISRQVGDLVYDRQALQHLYLGSTFPSAPAFCTDEDVGKIQDCQTFDNGRSILEGSQWSVQNALNNVAMSLINTYVNNKVPEDISTATKPAEQVQLNPLSWALISYHPRFIQYQSFTKAGTLAAVQSQYPFISSLNADIVKVAEDNYLRTTAADLGGMNLVFSPMDDAFADQAFNKFSTLLDTVGYGSGEVNGKAYAFTDDEKLVMRANGKLYMQKLQNYLIKLDLWSLAGNPLPKDPYAASNEDDDDSSSAPASAANSPIDKGLSQDLLPVITDRIERYVLPTVSGQALTGQLTLQPDADAKPTDPAKTLNVKLPQFKYAFDIRLAAAQLLAKGHSEDPSWAMAERAKYSQMVSDLVVSSLGTTLDKVDVSSLNHDLAEWILQNQQIVNALSGGDSGN